VEERDVKVLESAFHDVVAKDLVLEFYDVVEVVVGVCVNVVYEVVVVVVGVAATAVVGIVVVVVLN
jgi:hypothetical protein